MLRPAILYKAEILLEFQKCQYTTDMLYYTGCLANYIPDIVDCPGECTFQFAIVDDNTKKLIGYLEYSVNWYVSKAYNFGLFSFDRGNILVGKDVFNKLEELLTILHRIEWRAVEGNPACRGYDSFIKKNGGNKHVLKDAIKDKNGVYHDDIIYEIVNLDFDKY